MSKSAKIAIIILVIIILGLLGTFGYFYWKNLQAKKTTVEASPTPTPTVTAAVEKVTDPGVTWVKAQQLGDLGLIKSASEQGMEIDNVEYYKVADLDGGGLIILANITYSGPSDPSIARIKKDGNNKYYYLLNHSFEKSYLEAEKYLDFAKITIDSNTRYQSLSVPDFLKVGNVTIKSSGKEALFKNIENPQEVTDTPYGMLYKYFQNTSGDKGVNGRILVVKLSDSSVSYYQDKIEFLPDSGVAKVTWSDGKTNSLVYTQESYVGCGMVSADNTITSLSNIDSRLKEAGKTSTGDKIYTIGSSDKVMQTAYDNYKTGREDFMSLDEFASKKPVFVWKDGFNDYVVFTGTDFAGLAECGKPVIYLYPTKPTNVSVKVGAEIKKSDPKYDNGWQVLAEPSGKLIVANRVYDYLFWEGQGQNYPNITSGFIVEKDNVQAVIKDHLQKLGLNKKETADFLEFWLPKMPDNPYIRLTWLGTHQMNELAPLSIDPKPDTLIRVFLDFAGLDEPVSIPEQKLSAPERTGFTVIEWGGLLREEIK